SRAVMMTCVSAPERDETARRIWSGDAGPKNSWLIRASPCHSSTSATRSAHGARTSPARDSSLESSRTSSDARRWRRRWRPGSSSPASVNASLFSHNVRWRYVVPVLGSPMCRKTRSVTSAPLVVRSVRLGARAPPERFADVGAVAGQDGLDLGVVAVGHREQELHHHVAQLGQSQVDLPALLDLLLELRETVTQT